MQSASFWLWKRPKLILVVSAIGFWVLLFFGRSFWVGAQLSGQTLEISPPSQELTADPGKTITVKAKIRNNSNNSLPISVHIEDFTAQGEEGQVALTSQSPYSVASWTKVAPEKFELGSGQEREVVATITVPQNAAGGRYGSFVFGVDTEKKGGSASLSQAIASLFLLRINGPVSEILDLKELTAPSFSEFGPIPLSVKLENKGNVHVKTYGLINVTDMFGQKVADIVVPATNIFPQGSRIIQTQLSKTFLVGNYHALAILYYGSTQNQTLIAKTSFFVFPTRIAVVVFVVLLLLFFLRKRIGKAILALLT